MDKIKILLLSDSILFPSGVGTQSKYIVEALLRSGKFKISQFAGAIRHPSYQPMKFEEWGDDLIIYPVDEFGNKELLRSFIRQEKPDVMVIFTDPRFFVWLFEIANEIRPHLPIVFYSIWDNEPPPYFNRPYYLSCDKIACISKLTDRLIAQVAPEVDRCYLPHAVDPQHFKPLVQEDVQKFREQTIQGSKDKTLFFWNSRNARRKHPSTIIFWFKEFLDIVGHDKAALLMHTDVHDPNGPDLEAVIKHLGLVHGEVMFSQEKLPPESLGMLYNMVDCTLSLSEAEGHGLSTHESLSCGTPIIVPETGGLQDQATDGKDQFGFMIPAKCKMYAGSQTIPYILEDRVLKEDYIEALIKMHNLTTQERKALGLKGRDHILKNYNFEEYGKRWVELMLGIYEKNGSWATRKNFSSWKVEAM